MACDIWHACRTTVPGWYNTDKDCAGKPADEKRCKGEATVCNVTDILTNGHFSLDALAYLGEGSDWPTGYSGDPATNRTCTYPAGVAGGVDLG